MTYHDNQIQSSQSVVIVWKNRKIFYEDFPDFPIFEESMFPEEMWKRVDVHFDTLMAHIVRDPKVAGNLHDLLFRYFQGLSTPEERKRFLKKRRDDDEMALERYDELTDPSFVVPNGQEKEIQEELYGLHMFIKYVLGNVDELQEFEHGCLTAASDALRAQGYDVDICTGTVTRV